MALLRAQWPIALERDVTAFRLGASGIQDLAVGAGALPASLVFGYIWQQMGPKVAFGFGALLACLAGILLYLFIPPTPSTGGSQPA